MVFSSVFFLFAFLPTVILCYHAERLLSGNGLRNAVLLLFSYMFYLYGAAGFLLVLVLSTFADYLLGLLIDRDNRRKRLWLGLSVFLNTGLLVYFKYANFLIEELREILNSFGLSFVGWEEVIFPIGISFFTFQKLSYVIDIYRGKSRPTTNVVDFSLYVAMFPQLIAGPIIRFSHVSKQLKERKESWNQFHAGAMRFCWGLAKKVMIANSCGQIADVAFGLDLHNLDTKTAWLGSLAYTLQIYFDFSAYSDMAIGLGMLFGFRFPENFNLPYSATSITDFWRRWHISLSLWLRDYIYIPLGGSRRGAFRTYLNLAIVSAVCGIWHGANTTFFLWGLYHGGLLVLERATGLSDLPPERYFVVRRFATITAVTAGWVLFRSEDISQAIEFLCVMFTPRDFPVSYQLSLVLNYRNIVFSLIAATAFFLPGEISRHGSAMIEKRAVVIAASAVVILFLLPYCAAIIAGGPKSSFIYYRF
ncbi:MAG: MBOAT family protein [Deltaproteobacteria bacterium]|nr:MBOAT family protein [Deltaproteobacteria bacterium]